MPSSIQCQFRELAGARPPAVRFLHRDSRAVAPAERHVTTPDTAGAGRAEREGRPSTCGNMRTAAMSGGGECPPSAWPGRPARVSACRPVRVSKPLACPIRAKKRGRPKKCAAFSRLRRELFPARASAINSRRHASIKRPARTPINGLPLKRRRDGLSGVNALRWDQARTQDASARPQHGPGTGARAAGGRDR